MGEAFRSPSIRQIREAVRGGTLTIEQSVSGAFEEATRRQADLQAFSHIPGEPPINRTSPEAPLAGVAVAVKDIIDTADMPTEFNSPAYAGRRPERDAWVVARLRQAGASILGKTVTTEFAWRQPGPTVNPWNPDHTPGGSSSGSAAAVAAGIVPLALGTQTLGSVIRPAAYCGVVGFKPTYGTIGRSGVLPLAGSLDHVGIFTTSVADAAYALECLAGTDPEDPHHSYAANGPAKPGGRRIGVPSRQVGGAIEGVQQQALGAVAATLHDSGAEIVPVDLPAELFDTVELAMVLMAVEAAVTHGALVDRSPDLVSAAMRELVSEGRKTPAVQYARAKVLQVQMALRFNRWLTGTMALDALLVAPATGPAPRGLHYTGDSSFCAPWTFLGVPALTLPVGFSPEGLPLGAQLVGAAQSDRALLSLGEWVQGRTSAL